LGFSYIDQRIIVLYGFSPSLISTVLIIFNLLKANQRFILLIISFLLILQVAIDFIICKFYKKEDFFLILLEFLALSAFYLQLFM